MPSKKGSKEGVARQSPKPKRRRVKAQPGQIVAVPLVDGSFTVVHVAAIGGGITCVLFAQRGPQPERLLADLEATLKEQPIAVMRVTDNCVTDGSWSVIGHKVPGYPAELLNTRGRSYVAACLEDLFNAYYGLEPWDGMADPLCYERDLLPGVPVPATIRYKRDFEHAAPKAGGGAACAPGPESGSDLPIAKGPGIIHIEITYPGEELPTIPLLKRREAIENALEAAGVGEVTDAGGGGGVMDIYLETQDVARAMPFVHAAVKEAGFENDARIEVDPVSEDDEDDEDSAEDESN